MKKMFRKVLSFLLAVAIAGSVCPTGVFAADAGQPAQGGVVQQLHQKAQPVKEPFFS